MNPHPLPPPPLQVHSSGLMFYDQDQSHTTPESKVPQSVRVSFPTSRSKFLKKAKQRYLQWLVHILCSHLFLLPVVSTPRDHPARHTHMLNSPCKKWKHIEVAFCFRYGFAWPSSWSQSSKMLNGKLPLVLTPSGCPDSTCLVKDS